MARVHHVTQDPVEDLYRQVHQLKKLNSRMHRPIRVPVISSLGGVVNLDENDGRIWMDVEDTRMHFMLNGLQFHITAVQE